MSQTEALIPAHIRRCSKKKEKLLGYLPASFSFLVISELAFFAFLISIPEKEAQSFQTLGKFAP